MTARYIRHVTIDTGHSRDSYRSEIDDAVMPEIAELLDLSLSPGGVECDRCEPACHLVSRPAGRCIHVEAITLGGRSLVSFGVAAHSRCGAGLWRALHAGYPAVPPCPPEPWCAVRLGPGIVAHPEATAWLGDMERCIAWAWVERCDAA